jgi:hypothetical protein
VGDIVIVVNPYDATTTLVARAAPPTRIVIIRRTQDHAAAVDDAPALYPPEVVCPGVNLFGRRQRRERARGLTDENFNSGLRFKCGEEKLRLEVSFPPRFSIASDEQPVHATKLESSSKSKHYR